LRAIDSILKFKVDVAPWNPEASKAKWKNEFGYVKNEI
jgi:hypothetical protein